MPNRYSGKVFSKVGTMFSLRPMTLSDLPLVAAIDALAFAALPRTLRHLEACLQLNPQGCFVATLPQDEVVGYGFSRRWGRVGWIGVLGVRPDQQGRGAGKALVQQITQHLQSAGCDIIGLATEADRPEDVGIYIHLGFVPDPPTLELAKAITPVAIPPSPESAASFVRIDQVDFKAGLQAVADLSQAARDGLDYRPEVQSATTYGWGDTLLFGWPQPWAFAIVRTESIRADEPDRVLAIVALVMPDQGRSRLSQVLLALEQLARQDHFSRLTIAVNASDPEAVQITANCGFRVEQVEIRMTLGRLLEPSQGVDLSHWMM
jgi:GNAT superfamily N-acetyltransferase